MRITAIALVVVFASRDVVQSLAFEQEPFTVETVLEEFGRTSSERQRYLGKRIVRLGDRRLLRGLERRLNDEDRHVRANVAFVFAGLGDRRGFDVLSGILRDRSNRPKGQGIYDSRWSLEEQIRADRRYAVIVLGQLRDRRAVRLLLPLLTDRQLKSEVAWALGGIGDRRAIGPLIGALRDGDVSMRMSAAQALGQLKAVAALPYLRALLDDRALPRAADQIRVAKAVKAAIVTIESER